MVTSALQQKNGEITLVLGFSEKNIRRMRQGQPILFNIQERFRGIGVERPNDIDNVLVVVGEDEDSLIARLQEAFGPGIGPDERPDRS